MPNAPARLSFLRPWWRTVGLVAFFITVGFGFVGHRTRVCFECWSRVGERSVGLCLGEAELKLAWQDSETVQPLLSRFMLPGHVHTRFGGCGSSRMGLQGYIGCGLTMPARFGMALLSDSAFNDYVAARIADGTVSADDVRTLIAIDGREDHDGVSPALAAKERLLIASFEHVDPALVDLSAPWVSEAEQKAVDAAKRDVPR